MGTNPAPASCCHSKNSAAATVAFAAVARAFVPAVAVAPLPPPLLLLLLMLLPSLGGFFGVRQRRASDRAWRSNSSTHKHRSPTCPAARRWAVATLKEGTAMRTRGFPISASTTTAAITEAPQSMIEAPVELLPLPLLLSRLLTSPPPLAPAAVVVAQQAAPGKRKVRKASASERLCSKSRSCMKGKHRAQ